MEVVIGFEPHVFNREVGDDKKVRKAVIPVVRLHGHFQAHGGGMATDGNGRARNEQVGVREGALEVLVGHGLGAEIGVVPQRGNLLHPAHRIGKLKAPSAGCIALRRIIGGSTHPHGAAAIHAADPNARFKQMLGSRPSGVFARGIPRPVLVATKGVPKGAHIGHGHAHVARVGQLLHEVLSVQESSPQNQGSERHVKLSHGSLRVLCRRPCGSRTKRTNPEPVESSSGKRSAEIWPLKSVRPKRSTQRHLAPMAAWLSSTQ